MPGTRRTVILTSYMDFPMDLNSEYNQDDLLICTDGGYDIALEYGLKPAILMGDFDSINTQLPDDIPIIRFNPVKDYTDLQLALDKAIEIGSQDVEVWGGLGGRFDQTIANVQLLMKYTDKFNSLSIRDGANKAFILPCNPGYTHVIPAVDNWYLSIFAMSEICKNVSIHGTKYELDGYTLKRSFPLGVSNEFQSENATISYDSGIMLVILSKMQTCNMTCFTSHYWMDLYNFTKCTFNSLMPTGNQAVFSFWSYIRLEGLINFPV